MGLAASERAFFGAAALVFAASAAATVAWCGPMAASGGMPMPGGWTVGVVWPIVWPVEVVEGLLCVRQVLRHRPIVASRPRKRPRGRLRRLAS